MSSEISFSQVSAFAPATVGNVGVGFDVMGFSFPAVGDEVTLIRSGEPGIRIAAVTAGNHLVSKDDCAKIPRESAPVVVIVPELLTVTPPP